jgi:hypothetical protein
MSYYMALSNISTIVLSLALGLLDCALVNAYIVHKECFKRASKVPLSRADFLTTLQAQLLNIKALDSEEDVEVCNTRAHDKMTAATNKILCRKGALFHQELGPITGRNWTTSRQKQRSSKSG